MSSNEGNKSFAPLMNDLPSAKEIRERNLAIIEAKLNEEALRIINALIGRIKATEHTMTINTFLPPKIVSTKAWKEFEDLLRQQGYVLTKTGNSILGADVFCEISF